MQSIRKQAFSLTIANGLTRLMGFCLRIVTARMMGAEALGVMEMAHSVEMLALTPATAGTPTAMSRMTARYPHERRRDVLRAGLAYVWRLSIILVPAVLLLSPLVSRILGDERTVLPMLVNAPCILLLGFGSVYNGYCYGQQKMTLPAVNECVEQLVRCVAAIALLHTFRLADTQVLAALPCAAELLAATAVLIIFTARMPIRLHGARTDPALLRELRQLALPTVLSRLSTTGLRAFNAVLIPACLRFSGVSSAASTMQYGMLTGMAMPVLMLPGILTGSLSMAAAPAVTERSEHGHALPALVIRLRRAAFLIGLISAALIIACSDFIAARLYNTPALAGLLRLLAPSMLFMAIQQVQYGVITGLGLQRQQLTGSIAGACLATILTACLTPLPHLRLYGAGLSMMAGQLFTLIWGWSVVNRSLRNKTDGIPA